MRVKSVVGVVVAVVLAVVAGGRALAGGPPIVQLGLSEGQYQAAYGTLPPGYRPISVTAYGAPGAAQFCAAFVDDGVGPADWIARHDMTVTQFVDEMNLYRGDGFRVFCVDAYGEYPNERFTALWVRDAQDPNDWIVILDLTGTQLPDVVQAQRDLGSEPVWITTTEGASPRYSVAFRKNLEQHTYGWAYGIPAADYQDWVDSFRVPGMRPVCIDVGGTAADPRYSAIFFMPDGPNWVPQNEWSARHGQSLGAHTDFTTAMIDGGFVPSCITSFGPVETGILAAAWYRPNADREFTITGQPVSALSDLDGVMEQFMEDHQIEYGGLALVKGGRLLLAHGYNWVEPGAPLAEPETPFRWASVSKPITATGILQLVESHAIELDTKLRDIPGFDSTGWRDPRLMDDTIRFLLQHRGGWDPGAMTSTWYKLVEWSPVPVAIQEGGFDPMFRDSGIADRLNLELPIHQKDIIRFMKDYDANYEPGTDYAYSNFGYMLLGRVIEAVTGDPYEQWIRDHVLCPIGAGAMYTAHGLQEDVGADEPTFGDTMRRFAQNVYGAEPLYRPLEYGGFNIDNMDAHGGWVGSVVDLARFVGSFADKTASPLLSEPSIDFMFATTPESGDRYGAGWQATSAGGDRYHNGSLPGTWAYIVRRSDRITFAVVFNERGEDNLPPADWSSIFGDINTVIDGITVTGAWPVEDWFRLYTPDTTRCPRPAKDAVHHGQVRDPHPR